MAQRLASKHTGKLSLSLASCFSRFFYSFSPWFSSWKSVIIVIFNFFVFSQTSCDGVLPGTRQHGKIRGTRGDNRHPSHLALWTATAIFPSSPDQRKDLSRHCKAHLAATGLVMKDHSSMAEACPGQGWESQSRGKRARAPPHLRSAAASLLLCQKEKVLLELVLATPLHSSGFDCPVSKPRNMGGRGPRTPTATSASLHLDFPPTPLVIYFSEYSHSCFTYILP